MAIFVDSARALIFNGGRRKRLKHEYRVCRSDTIIFYLIWLAGDKV